MKLRKIAVALLQRYSPSSEACTKVTEVAGCEFNDWSNLMACLCYWETANIATMIEVTCVFLMRSGFCTTTGSSIVNLCALLSSVFMGLLEIDATAERNLRYRYGVCFLARAMTNLAKFSVRNEDLLLEIRL